MKYLLLLLTFWSFSIFSQNSSCSNMTEICLNQGTYTAASGVAAASITDPGNDYGCLSSSPNPSWFYLEITQSGQIDMSLSAPSDIDFIIYGPYTDLATAQGNCNSMSSTEIVDCSYSGTNLETPAIGNSSTGGPATAVAGNYYVLLITNYANSTQDITIEQTGGTGAVQCLATPNPCLADAGTFTSKKNGVITTSVITLCEGESFSFESNIDFVLPSDTISAPYGDGIYTAQLMWLVYNSEPISNNPLNDPSYLNMIIATDTLTGTNNALDPLFQDLGLVCGTYYFVPVTGDDGNGDGGLNDNGGLHFDKDNNGCYDLGPALEVTFICPIESSSSIDCSGLENIVNVTISEGSGDYTITNQGNGTLSTTSVLNGGVLSISNLDVNDLWHIQIQDDNDCNAEATGVFSFSTIDNITVTDASSCSAVSLGNVSVNIGDDGQGPFTVFMNSTDVTSTGPNYNMDGSAGTIIDIIATDALGCSSQESVIIGSSSHYIDISLINSTEEICHGVESGSAIISANPVDAMGNPDGNIISINWTDPLGNIHPGDETNNSRNNMMSGLWIVTATDDQGCDVSMIIEILETQILELEIIDNTGLSCFGLNDGSITVSTNGGTFSSPISYDWISMGGQNPSVSTINTATQNNLSPDLLKVYVMDDNGCQDSLTAEIIEPLELQATFTIVNETCFGDENGAIYIDTVYNNIGTISYLWDVFPYTNPQITTDSATGLLSGNYQINIIDNNGCEKNYQFDIAFTADSLYFIDFGSTACTSGNDGSVFAEVGGLVSSIEIDYIWEEQFSGQTNNGSAWYSLGSGDYTFVATSNLGCTITETTTIGCSEIYEENINELKVTPTIVIDGGINVINNGKNDKSYKILIYDSTGRLVYESIALSQLFPKLANGNYIYNIIEIENNNIAKKGKIIFMTN